MQNVAQEHHRSFTPVLKATEFYYRAPQIRHPIYVSKSEKEQWPREPRNIPGIESMQSHLLMPQVL